MPNRLSTHEYVLYTKELLAHYGLPGTWQVRVVPNMGRRLGTCSYAKQLIRLNQGHLESSADEAIVDTIKHEVAHAVARHRYGSAIKPHGAEWKATATELGATPRASVPLTNQEKALRDANRTLSSLLNQTSTPRAAKGRKKKTATASFYSSELSRTIKMGDIFTLHGKTYEILETKRTRFTGKRKHDGRIYSISAHAISRGTFKP